MEKIGDIINKRRKELGFTQKQLSAGICSQAQLCRIEKNLHNPSHDKLYQLFERLNLKSYSSSFSTEYIDISKIISELHDYVYLRKYKKLYEYIHSNKLWDLIVDDEYTQQLFYFEGIYASHYKNDQVLALNMFFNGLKHSNSDNIINNFNNTYNKKLSEIELFIIGAIGTIYFKLKNYHLANQYFKFSIDNFLKFYKRNNYKDIGILLYSSAKNNKYLKQYTCAQRNCQMALEILSKCKSTFRLAEINYELGELARLQNNIAKAELYYITSINIAAATKNKVILNYILEDLKQYNYMTLLQNFIDNFEIIRYD